MSVYQRFHVHLIAICPPFQWIRDGERQARATGMLVSTRTATQESLLESIGAGLTVTTGLAREAGVL
jgi:hypothetical protein